MRKLEPEQLEVVTQSLDPIVEDDIQRGWKIIPVPADIRTAMKGEDMVPFDFVRMTRLNMAKRRKITELVQRAYQKDLQDKELLSNAQVLKLVTERGEWSEEMEDRLKALGQRTTSDMAELYNEGIARSHLWAEELAAHTTKILEDIQKSEKPQELKDELERRFLRWQQYTPERQADYVDAFAKDIEAWGGIYYPDKDLSWLQDNLPSLESADLLEDIGVIVDRINQYLTLVKERGEYEELRVKRLRIFANTVESRRDNAEEMARLFHTAERCTEDGTPLGTLAATFDGVYNFPDPVIEWLVEEQFFFHNAISDETRQFLRTFGFTRAEPEKETPPAPLSAEESGIQPSGSPGSPPPSDASPVAPIANSDTSLSTATAPSSSA